MAQVLQITDGTTTIDLLTGNLQARVVGWNTTTSEEQVWETIDLVAATTAANVRTTKKQLDSLAQNARDYHKNQQNATGIFFKWQSEGESAKQALVYQIESEILAEAPATSPLLYPVNGVYLRVAILRHQSYESVSGDQTDSEANLSTLGGIWDIRSVIGSAAMGTAPGRIKSLAITDCAPTPNVIQKLWMGIRPFYKGTSAFVALWEAESLFGVSTPSATASAGNYGLCDLTSTANEGLRGSIEIGNVVGSNYDHFVGKYLVLMRAKVDVAGTEVAVDIRQFWQGSYSHAGSTYIDGVTSWTLFPLGEVSFPPTGNRDSVASGSGAFDDCGFSVFALSADDTGELHIDCFILIPAEYLCVVEGCLINTTGSSPLYTLILYTDPDDHQWGLGESTLAQGGLQPTFENWEYPIDGGILVFAAQGSTGHVLSTTADLAITVTPRWKSYR